MKYDDFLKWLQDECGMSERSARDVVSRSKRALVITKQKTIDSQSMNLLTASEEFIGCSMSIKSQLKRAVTLYMGFLDSDKVK